MKEIELWQAKEPKKIPANLTDIKKIVPLTDKNNLTVSQQNQVINAFNAEAFDMAAEYVWRKAMSKLKESISFLGDDFIMEMLQRPGTKSANLDSALTEYNTIRIAEQLGMITQFGALKLRQALETLQYCFSSTATIEGVQLDALETLNIIKICIELILSEPKVDVAVEFSSLRERLFHEQINENDKQIEVLVNSSLFFIRTVCTVLSNTIKTEKGAIQENAIANYRTILPEVWLKLTVEDRWKAGFLYRDVVSSGDDKASAGIKTALSRVNGFDYVPENIRSLTFIDAANKLVDTHFGYDNFYREPRAVRELANLGSIIPEPAWTDCLRAYLLVLIGNKYGRSNEAVAIAQKHIEKLPIEAWIAYLDNTLPYDSAVLSALWDDKPQRHFSNLINTMGLDKLQLETKKGNLLLTALNQGNCSLIRRFYLNSLT